MTNQATLITILKKYYDIVEPVSETVIQCQRYYEGSPYQMVFIDHSDNFLSYDLGSYLKQYVSTAYFRNAGILQWNFYLIFLTEQTISDQDRLYIEGNSDYARKLIIAATEMTSWLARFYLTNRKKSETAQVGLADVWKSILKTQKLDCIFSDQIKVNDGVDRIISGDNFIEEETKKSNRQFHDQDIHIGELRYFNPIKFRTYPKFSKPFSFKKVNLIDGANGHGKTSLLEAIEFFITGSNYRVNQSDNIYQIEAQFTADSDIRKYKKDTALFRERDRVWYNGMDKQRGSDLAAHFNQFNFYNTDAAFRLTVNKNEKEIEQAFREIALGDEVNFLKRQFSDYAVKIQSELKSRHKLIEEYGGDINEQHLLLTELRKTDGNETVLIQSLYEKLKGYNLKLNTAIQDLVSLDRLKFNLNVLSSELDTAFKDVNWLEHISIVALKGENIKLGKLVAILNSNNDAVNAYLKNINDLNASAAYNKQRVELLTNLTGYFQDNANIFIIGLSERLKSLRTKVKLLQGLRLDYYAVSLFTFEFPELPLNEGRRNQSENLKEKEKAIVIVDQQIETGQQTLSDLQAIISTIRNQGKQYLSLDENGTKCPLCLSDFGTSEGLRNALIASMNSTIEKNEFTSLLELKSNLEKEKKNIENQIDMLFLLTQLLEISSLPLDPNTVNTLIIKSELESLLATTSTFESELEELEALALSFAKKGLDEEHLNILQLQFASTFDSAKISEKTLKTLLDQLNQDQESIYKLLIRNQEMVEKNANIILDSIQAYDPTFNVSMEELLRKRHLFTDFHLKELANLLDEKFDEQKDLRQLKLELIAIIQQVDEIRADIDLKQKEGTIAIKANEIIKEKTVLQETAKEEHGRLKASLDALNQLLQEHSEDDFLQVFLNTNKEEIKEIFISIHAPKEFNDINIVDGKILLEKMNGDNSDIMRISTGQRSALALSLFLTLNNKLRNGPPMIIFDDPVAFTDDLNVLSFLDYLRETILSQPESKQLFFATANENLSFLFQKKFEMLGFEFNHIMLER